ncbi:MAG: ABC transporter permease [Oscillospiraceae bacterium]|nr:ABC transporter permease [Oscillospiraceae bacterium]
MGNFFIFFKKELAELVKTVKGVVLAAIFAVVGISSPLIAKLTPDILKMAGIDISPEQMAAMGIKYPPSSIESYEQFFGNFNTLGLLAVVIVFAGLVANEKAKNTAAYILTKNISRTQFLLSKFASSAFFVFVSLGIAMGAQIFYTKFLFEDNLVETGNVMLFFALVFLYLIFILALVLFSSVLAKNVTTATFLAFGIFMVFNILAAIPKVGEFLPPGTNNFGILTKAAGLGDIGGNIAATVLFSAVFAVSGIIIFNRQEL